MPRKTIKCFFDFDHTIIDGNSDTFIQSLSGESGIPEHIKERSNDFNGWTNYMNCIFNYLYELNVSKDDYMNCLSKIPLVAGMNRLLRTLKERNCEIIILSDCNSFFIEFILGHHQLKDTVSEIFTNKAKFNSNGCLQIEKFQEKNDCSICPDNLCKGYILENYLAQRDYDFVFYIGDGGNDLCPTLKLNSDDIVFPREGYRLLKALKKLPKESIQCQIKPWSHVEDILTICDAYHTL